MNPMRQTETIDQWRARMRREHRKPPVIEIHIGMTWSDPRAHPMLPGCQEWLRKQMDKQREKETNDMRDEVQGTVI